MDGVHAKCTNEQKKACRNEVQWVPRAVVDGATGKLPEARCQFCKQKNVLRVLGRGELEENRDAKARLKEGGRP